ncbi:hypothetical protein BX600DRAFT_282043 [Xylariales sp. PMI_506]|nr:hypothetical protein BX600DRAFT_282043 [Xylariales sp. PMI_506]
MNDTTIPLDMSTASPGSIGAPSATSHRLRKIRGPWADEPWPLLETPSRTQQITHPALHIANEIAHGHNAALRGLNAIFLQAPHVAAPADIADLLFLTHCWCVWVLNTHLLRQTQIFPGFEEILEEHPGTLTDKLGGQLDFAPALERLLQYAGATQPKPELYNPVVLQGLVQDLAPVFRANVACQIPLIAGMMMMQQQPPPQQHAGYNNSGSGSGSSSSGNATRDVAVSAAATPMTTSPPPPLMEGGGESPEAERRAGRLLQLYLAAEAEASNAMDRLIVPPMVVRLRDATFEGGNSWPGLSVLAVHAIADRLSPAHAGAWRFLPCDVWGRPRELEFLGRDGQRGDGSSSAGGGGGGEDHDRDQERGSSGSGGGKGALG